MKTKLFLGLAVLFFMDASAFSQVAISLDENGNGSINGAPANGGIGIDPTTGGPALSYFSPLASAVPGDVLLLEPGSPTGAVNSDLVRFLRVNGGTQVLFYSDATAGDPNPALADLGLPANVGSTAIGAFRTFTEVGLEAGPNGFTYNPGPNDPGYFPINTAGAGPTYTIISDLPEPASLALLGTGIGISGLFMAFRRYFRRITVA